MINLGLDASTKHKLKLSSACGSSSNPTTEHLHDVARWYYS